MSETLRSYEVARKTFSFLEFIGWSLVVLGMVAGLLLVASASRYADGGQKFLLFMMGSSGSIFGLFLVGCVQNWRAGVDSAEYGQQSLKVAREQLEISKQSLKSQNGDRNSFAALNSADERSASAGFGPFTSAPAQRSDKIVSPQETEYRGEVIKLYGGSYRAIGRAFNSQKEAQVAIDKKLDIPSLEIAPPIAETQPVQQSNGRDEETPRSFAELRATKFEEAKPQSDAPDVTVDQTETAPLDGKELTSHEEPQEFEPPVAELEAEPVEDIEIDVKSAVAEAPKKPELKIEEDDGKFVYGRLSFSSREAAEQYVSRLGVNPNFTG